MSIVSGTVLVSASVINNDSVKDVYYIRARDAVTAKLNSKYLHITLKGGNKEDIISALAEKARKTERCSYCNERLVYVQQAGRPGNSASLDRVWNSLEISEHNVDFICDLCNSGKSTLTPAGYIKKAFTIVSHINSEAVKHGMSVDGYIKWRWPSPAQTDNLK